ncbi:hypothetical protein ETAA8_04010 [Anatilimnocola aggregata]|uniref:CorA-like Mg2+ transporter protein n=1 Tax=Anatilimnocola aggregata TaxID=2528021 RepID=A0A517Y561_9BACT|nr:hypothetical protein [Anatilimnocola aggregata]QDU25336.1 hypothetical protein ETAA8_04010 [Anatilimnocola aggregata]
MPVVKNILPPTWDIPAGIRERLGDKVGRQRAMMADGHLLLVLHKLPKANESERQGRFFWRKPDGNWLSSDLGPGAAALAKHLSEFSDLVDKFDRLEDNASTVDEMFRIIEAMGPLHRTTRNLHAALQEARTLISSDRDLINFRDRAYEIERAAELLLGEVQTALDFALAKKTEEQTAASHQMALASHRLNLLAAFFFPIVTLCSIFGVSLNHGIESIIPPPFAFLGVVALGLLLGFILCSILAATMRFPGTSKKR